MENMNPFGGMGFGGGGGFNPFMTGPGMGAGGLGGMNTNILNDMDGEEATDDGQLAAMLQQNPELVLQLMMDRYREERKQKGRIRCPVCTTIHRPIKKGQKSVCAHVSHNALEVWVPAPCPICLEDLVQPPNIALPCGHVVCPEDFEQIGGKIVERNKAKEEEVVSDDEEVEDDVEFRREFMDHLQTTGVLPARAAATLEDMMMRNNNNNNTPASRRLIPGTVTAGVTRYPPNHVHHSDEDMGNDDSEDGSVNSMPSLLQGAGADSSSNDDDDDGDLPALLNRGTGDDSSSSDDDDEIVWSILNQHSMPN